LPLAIELAAARLRGLPLAEVAARLDDRFRLLTGGSRTALPRHRTLRAVVEWSWDLLSEPEQVLLERLAVFPAGATPESAAAVGAGDAVRSDDVVDLLASLVDKSLLQQHAGSAGVRFRMLETIREFGLERLAARGELAGRRVVFAGWFADLVSRSEPALHGPDQLDHLRVLRDERDNVVAALGVCCDAGDAAGALAIAVPSASLAMQLGNHAEAVGWLNAALATPGESDPALRAVAVALRGVHSAASDFVYERGHDHDALLDEAAAALEGEGVTAYQMGAILRPVVAMFRRDPALPRILEEALASEDPWVSAVARILRSGVAENSGDPEGMRRDAEIALAQFRVLGDRWGTSEALCALAQQHVFTGDYDRAAEEYDEAIALIREMGSTEDEARALIWLADLRVRQGDMSAARAAVGEAVELTDGAGSAMVRTITLAMQAHVERLTGDLPRARELQRELSARLGRLPRAPAPMRHAEAMARGFSAQIDLAAGDVAAAREGVEHAWTAALGTADMPILAGVGVAVADVLAAVGGHDLAGEVLGATSAIRGVPDPSGADIARLAAALRAQLGDASASASIARGEALDRQAAIDRISRAIEEIRGAPALVVASDPAPVGGQG
jgi:tetratricopeptide (TPR) repeat protein